MFRLFLFMMILMVSANCLAQQNTLHAKLRPFAWLEGTWKRSDMKAGSEGYEIWTIVGYQLKGRGILIKNNDTIELEKVRLTDTSSSVFYVADVPANKREVYFRVIRVKQHQFLCENNDHDFPKRIHYQLSGRTMKVTISGNGKSIDYVFVRQPTN